jgi:hypothetical protein
MNTTILDTHLHLYPCYDLSRAFNQFLDNTAQYGKQVFRVACLAERHDCQYFNSIANRETELDGFTLKNVQTNEIQLNRNRDNLNLSLLPGRQIISRENLEVLALGCPDPINDGQPVLDVIYQIIQLGHVPVLPWSPGKWFGHRGEMIKRLITQLNAEDFLIGDTPLRPYGWATPKLMKLAQKKGFSVVAGSDPLPFSGEESWLGAYYSIVESEEKYAANELLHALKIRQYGLQLQSAGKRSNIFSLFNRLRKNAASKKSPV